jgi:hypothetical protein
VIPIATCLHGPKDPFGAGGPLFSHSKLLQLIRITNVSVLAEATAAIHESNICSFSCCSEELWKNTDTGTSNKVDDTFCYSVVGQATNL